MILSFVVYGKPQPQGSHKVVPVGKAGHRVTDSNESLPGWRNSVLLAARAAITDWGDDWDGPLIGPIRLTLGFYLPRPLGAPKTRDILPVRKPDTSKLIRAVEDSLTDAGVWADDAQVVAVNATKHYAVGPHLSKIYRLGAHRAEPCVEVEVMPL